MPTKQLCNGMLNSVLGRASRPRPGNRQFVAAAVQDKVAQVHRPPIPRSREGAGVDAVDLDRESMIGLGGRGAVGDLEPEFDTLVQSDHKPRHRLIGLEEGVPLQRMRDRVEAVSSEVIVPKQIDLGSDRGKVASRSPVGMPDRPSELTHALVDRREENLVPQFLVGEWADFAEIAIGRRSPGTDERREAPSEPGRAGAPERIKVAVHPFGGTGRELSPPPRSGIRAARRTGASASNGRLP